MQSDRGKEIARMALVNTYGQDGAMLEQVIRYCMDELGHLRTDSQMESFLGDLFCEAGLNGEPV